MRRQGLLVARRKLGCEAMFFSVIVPVYNRARFLPRCLASVFSQDFDDFEIIAIDDGSTDGSLSILQGEGDPRLRVLSHAQNRGVCPARNTGIAAARGTWIVALDSDDELAAGALACMHRLAIETPDSVHALWFRCRMDDGRISPDPMPSAQEWDYAGYVAWLAESRGRWRDVLRCVRRPCFELVRYPEDRMLEEKYHLDFARRFRSRNFPDVLRLYHQDAENSLVRRGQSLDPKRDGAYLVDRSRGLLALLQDHGAALHQASPALFGDFLQLAGLSTLLEGDRRSAWRIALTLVMEQPRRLVGWKMLAASLTGPDIAMRLRRLFARS